MMKTTSHQTVSMFQQYKRSVNDALNLFLTALWKPLSKEKSRLEPDSQMYLKFADRRIILKRDTAAICKR